MGILYDAVKKANLHQEMKRNFVIDRLKELGVTHSQQGKSIMELNYDDLKYELVLASFRQIDMDNESGKWF